MIRAPNPAGHAGSPGVVIVSLRATPAGGLPLPASGARVRLDVRVRNAARCTFVRQYSAVSSLYPYRTLDCRFGRASVTIPAIANRHRTPVWLTYGVRVKDVKGNVVQRVLKLRQQAAPKPPPTQPPDAPTADLTLQPTTVPASGGSVTAIFASENATSCSLAANPALWTDAGNPVPVACNGSKALTVPASATGGSWTLTFTAADASGRSVADTETLTEEAAPAPPPPPARPQPQPPAGAQLSENWSGYFIASPTVVTWVSGRWTVPQLNCSSTPNAGGSVWVGLGGISWPGGGDSGDLLQTGVRMDCANGSPDYAAWWEQYPQVLSYEFRGLPVSAGDQMMAVVNQARNGQWQTRVDDLSKGVSGVYVANLGWGVMPDSGDGHFTLQGRSSFGYAGGASAEWIVEAYERNGRQVPLVNYGTVTISDLRTSLPSWSLAGPNAVAMLQNGNIVSTPSEVSGSGFTLTYTGR